MDRLELILSEIDRDTALQEERILQDAKARGEALLKEARLEAQAEAEALLEEARERAAQNRTIAQSGAVALRKKRLLEEKSRVIREAIQEHQRELEALPDEAYFAFFLKKLASMPPEGEILISEKEKKRDRKALEKGLEKLSSETGKSWTLAPETTSQIPSGILVRYGKIEENLSLEAIFAAGEDSMKDRLYAVLFKD